MSMRIREGGAAALASRELARITRLSAVDTVRARIGLAIELGLLGPGERLPSGPEIAHALGVSEITARRALKTMTDEGLLERRRGRNGGTFTTGALAKNPDRAVEAFRDDAAEVRRLIDLRSAFECTLAHHAALNATPEHLSTLAACVDHASRTKTWTDYHALDEKFHRGVAAASGLDWIQHQYDQVLTELYRYFIPYPIDALHAANAEHARLVQALEERDTVAAVQTARDHIQHLHATMFVGEDFQSRGR